MFLCQCKPITDVELVVAHPDLYQLKVCCLLHNLAMSKLALRVI